MDTSGPSPDDPREPSPIGMLEPAHRADVAKRLFQTPDDPPEQSYECRDPLTPADAPVIYRSAAFDDVVAVADDVGSTQLHGVDRHGRRTTWNRIDGLWRAPGGACSPGLAPARKGDGPDNAGACPPARAGLAAIVRDAGSAAERERLEARLRVQFVAHRAPAGVDDLRRHCTEYRMRGPGRRLAFTASLWKVCTDVMDPVVVRAMIDVAQLRQWGAVRVYGDAAFRRMVWIEAAARGLPARGHEPSRDDLHQVRRLRQARRNYGLEPWPWGAVGRYAAEAAADPRAHWQDDLAVWLEDRQVAADVARAVLDCARSAGREGSHRFEDGRPPHPPGSPDGDATVLAGSFRACAGQR